MPRGGRRPLRALDEGVRAHIDGLRSEIDAEAAFAVWSDALAAPVWDGTPVWVHADLRGYALFQVSGIAYYRETNPGFATLARRTVREVLAEFGEFGEKS